jgi:MoxR-like ATPase
MTVMSNDFGTVARMIAAMRRVMVGKDGVMELLATALLAEGHVLLEDVPGLGKTLMAKCLARVIGGSFRRVQFTPDLLPADITGFNVYDQRKAEFRFQPGPVMSNVLLADEINRTIPRTQSSLLESMGEGQVTVDGVTQILPRPFFVVATQNPIELEGTFPLPEAQLDRFLMKIALGYPNLAEELEILDRFREDDPLERLAPVASPEEVARLQEARRHIAVSAPIKQYIAGVVQATRADARIKYGASPRGSLFLMRAAQALAAVRGRDFVLPDDVKELAGPVLAHRLILKSEERLRGMDPLKVVADVLDKVPIQPDSR